jgi:hypothetical protein
VDLDEIFYVSDGIKYYFYYILFNPVASTIPKWRTFKLPRWVLLLNLMVDFDEILYDDDIEDDLDSILINSVASTIPNGGRLEFYARRISSPRMKSSVIPVTNTRVHRPRLSAMRASFATGIVSLDAICRMYGRLSFLSGSPATMSGLVMVTRPGVDAYSAWLLLYPAVSHQAVPSTLSVKRGGVFDDEDGPFVTSWSLLLGDEELANARNAKNA